MGFLFLFVQHFIVAQEVPEIIHFTHPNIIYQQIWDITQAPDQRMYFGTTDGLVTFDGSKWEILKDTQADVIRTVAAHSDGKIYKGNYDEFGYWKRDVLDQLTYTSLSAEIGMETKEEIWHTLFLDSAVYFQSFSIIYKYEVGRVEKIIPPGNIMFLQAVRGKLFFQKIGGGIYEMNTSNSFQLLPATQFFADKKVVFILPFGKDELLVGTEQNGIYVFNNLPAEQAGNEITKWKSPWQSDFSTNQLNKGIQLSNGDFALGTILNGVYILDKNGLPKVHLNRQTGLPDNTVLSLAEDQAGNLWLGLEKGVALVNLNNTLRFYRDMEGELGTVYSAVQFEDHLYVGTNRGVFYKKNTVENPADAAKFQFVQGTQGQVWQLGVFGNQLLCGHNEGTFLIHKNQVKKIADNNGGWVTRSFSKNANVLLQGTYAGLIVFKKNEMGEWFFANSINGFSEPVKEMVIDSTGAIWLAHPEEGLHRVELDATHSEITYLHKFSAAEGLPTDKLLNLVFAEGKVLVRAGKKWLRYDEKNKRFEPSGTFHDVPLAALQGKIVEAENGFWFESLPREVNYFFEKNRVRTFPLTLGRGYGNPIRLSEHDYLFSLENGYARVATNNFQAARQPNGQDISKKKSPLKIHQLEVATEDSIFSIPLGVENLKFKNHQNRLHFYFYQTHFSESPEFRYRLLGAENNWSAWSEQSDQEYFNLGAGQYEFQVESKIEEQVANLKFEILPHWTQSSWAYFLYFLGLLGLIALLYFLQKRKFEATKHKMQQRQERLLAEQQMKTNNEKLQLDVVNKSKQLANSTMNLVQKNEILLQIKNELQQLKKKQEVQIPGKDYQQLLHLIDTHLTSEQDWELFEKNFNQVHEQFLKQLKANHPELTPGDLQLAAYLKMNLSSKEIAPLLHISIRGIENKRYRLRKKLNLPKDANLTEYLMKF